MALCKDPSLTYLNEQGYNVVKLPRAGIEPMDVLGRDGKAMERLGKLTRIWASDSAVPEQGQAKPAAAMNGTKTGDLKLSIGLKMLSDILGGMGAAVPQLNFAYQNAKSVQFTYTDVHSVSVSPFQIGDFLSEGDLNTSNPFVAHYFEDDDTEAYVISETLISNSISVTGKKQGGAEVEVDVPAIQEVVGANVTVSKSGSQSTVVTYSGQVPLTFGFKVFGIAYADGKWQVQGLKPSGELAFGDYGDQNESVLVTKGGRVSLKML